MDKAEAIKLMESMSLDELMKLKKTTTKPKPKETRIPFKKITASSDVIGPRVCTSTQDVKTFLCETLIPNLDLRPTASIKAQFVEGFSLLADLVDDPKAKEKLLKTAARAVMMDRDHLIKYIAAVVST